MNPINNYITLSLETHLYFARIMKEHALFLAAGFPCKNTQQIKCAYKFRQDFEDLLREVTRFSNQKINSYILDSNELVTEYTLPAEDSTSRLTGIPIDMELTRMQNNLNPKTTMYNNGEQFRMVRHFNNVSLNLLNGLIAFKENILMEVNSCNLFTFNYPLLIEHIIREAQLYRTIIMDLNSNPQRSYQSLCGTEEFWNQIMMEHALFIRGLLDPSEEELIILADNFSKDYKKLLSECNSKDSYEKTLEYRDFKTAGTKGIVNCEIKSLILPLLADHVLREANHYIRIMEHGGSCKDI